MKPKIELHAGDLPEGVDLGPVIAVDTETLGLKTTRDRLCLVQLSAGDGVCHAVQFTPGAYRAPNLCRLLVDPDRLKLFHFARFDLAAIKHYLGAVAEPVYCTRTASRLIRTYTGNHGLKDLCAEILGVKIPKEQQSSDWGADKLSQQQLEYAAKDVIYLHKLKEDLDARLEREGRLELAQAVFEFLPARASLDLVGFADEDILAHS